MLFRNLRSGNLVEATDPDTVSMMDRSPNYEKITRSAPAPASVDEAPKPVPAKKRTSKAKSKE